MKVWNSFSYSNTRCRLAVALVVFWFIPSLHYFILRMLAVALPDLGSMGAGTGYVLESAFNISLVVVLGGGCLFSEAMSEAPQWVFRISMFLVSIALVAFFNSRQLGQPYGMVLIYQGVFCCLMTAFSEKTKLPTRFLLAGLAVVLGSKYYNMTWFFLFFE